MERSPLLPIKADNYIVIKMTYKHNIYTYYLHITPNSKTRIYWCKLLQPVSVEQCWVSRFSNSGLDNKFPDVSLGLVAGIFTDKVVCVPSENPAIVVIEMSGNLLSRPWSLNQVQEKSLAKLKN